MNNIIKTGFSIAKLQNERFANVKNTSQSKNVTIVINIVMFGLAVTTLSTQFISLEMSDYISVNTNNGSVIDNGKITFVYYGFAANITDISNRDDRFAIKKNDSADPNYQFAFSKNGFAGTNYYAPIANHHFANEKIKFESGKMRMQVKNRFYNLDYKTISGKR